MKKNLHNYEPEESVASGWFLIVKISVHSVKGRPRGSIAQLAECSHGKREALGSSPGRATIFSSPVTFGGQLSQIII